MSGIPKEATPPSVLVVLVARDGAAWITRCLASLARQTHPRLGVVAVDDGSVDGSGEILARALGARRVIRLEHPRGIPAAVGAALSTEPASRADFLLILHDDTLLAPDAIARLVDVAGRLEDVGIVGPKVLDWNGGRVLREVGLSTDRFGYPYSPLEEGEIDQGQYDTSREVLSVSSTAMLVAHDAWMRAGLPDERLGPAHADVDFCWRVRLAGYRVLVEPTAVVAHRAAEDRGERRGGPGAHGRYLSERAGLAALLKNYRGLTLLWILPLYLLQGLGKLALFLVSRRFDAASQVARAWGWNLFQLPGTVRRRVHAQAVRQARDREIWRYMAPAGARLRRWVLQAASVLVAGRTTPFEAGERESVPAERGAFRESGPAERGAFREEAAEPVPLRTRLATLAAAHPVGVAWVAAVVLSLVAFRHVLFADLLEGGALPAFPPGASDLFREFGAGWRSRAFGGAGGASPALVPLGLGSALTLGNPRLFVRVFLAVAPVLAAVSCYRAVLRRVRIQGPAVVAAACYGLSATVLWATSEGRLPSLVFLIAVPWATVRLFEAFEEPRPQRPLAWMVATGMGLAVTASFFPTVWIAVGAAILPCLVVPGPGGSRLRGLGLSTGAGVALAVLVFPFTAELIRTGGGGAADAVGRAEVGALLRLSPGAAPGSWVPAAFLPVAGILAFPLASDRRWAWRAGVIAAGALPAAWLSAAGHLPAPVHSPVAYVGVAAFSLSLLVGLASSALVSGRAIRHPQLAVAGLAAAIGVGLLFQSASVVRAGWAIGEEREPAGWPVVATADPRVRFRVLWLGDPGQEVFPAPGGSAEGQVAAGTASVRYGITGRSGRSILDVGLPAADAGYERLELALRAILGGRVRHGGALLAPLGVRYLVAGEGDLPEAVSTRLAAQVDLDLLQAGQPGGLVIYRNPRALPVASVAQGLLEQARSTELLAPAEGLAGAVIPLRRAEGRPDWEGISELEAPGLAYVATGFDGRWKLEVAGRPSRPPFRAFGWALGFEAPAGTHPVRVSFGGQWVRTLEVAALAIMWSGALWLTRRRVR